AISLIFLLIDQLPARFLLQLLDKLLDRIQMDRLYLSWEALVQAWQSRPLLLAEMLLIDLPSTLRWPEHVFPLNLSELVSVLATFVPHLHRHIPSAYRPFQKQRKIESPVCVYAGLSSSKLSLPNQSNRL